ncbi:uncharacterized protein BO88DRAFT_468748 [Aspergillus vadensis CBS 113365]|uniref:Uncharacterized protein n=1 Tax=Aspergillus vadensis (strain CBS 113365 / IMI 142717 / IBT 24658) TaxID=1448311 RepID=A0A319BQR2_ASPVC|nr:hypothetical protein BO88DRAFT_468748 [Aspergillus vadensis CBS 113365]PYH73999.1 hypothetical protein BO88DRAFT_468748 [Aspergillus vadensis CBS 113365]
MERPVISARATFIPGGRESRLTGWHGLILAAPHAARNGRMTKTHLDKHASWEKDGGIHATAQCPA